MGSPHNILLSIMFPLLTSYVPEFQFAGLHCMRCSISHCSADNRSITQISWSMKPDECREELRKCNYLGVYILQSSEFLTPDFYSLWFKSGFENKLCVQNSWNKHSTCQCWGGAFNFLALTETCNGSVAISLVLSWLINLRHSVCKYYSWSSFPSHWRPHLYWIIAFKFSITEINLFRLWLTGLSASLCWSPLNLPTTPKDVLKMRSYNSWWQPSQT